MLRQMLIREKIVPEPIAELVPEVLQIAFDFRDAAANSLLFHTDQHGPVLPVLEMLFRDLIYGGEEGLIELFFLLEGTEGHH